jgi:hypothetical protein
MSGKWPSSPVAVAGTDGAMHVFGVGTDGHLYERSLPSGGGWSGWAKLGGKWPWNPAAVAGPSGTVRVFAVGTNGQLYQKHLRADGTASNWIDVGSSNLTGTPAATFDATGTVHVYARSAAASHTMRVATLAPGKQWAWTNLHGTWHYDPAAVAARDGSARVFAVGTTGQLYQKHLYADGTWSSWMDLGTWQLKGTPAAVLDQTNVTHVYTRVSSGALKEKSLSPNGTWAQVNLHGSWHYDPVAVVDHSDIVRVYDIGSDGSLYENHMRVGHAWSGWFKLGGP